MTAEQQVPTPSPIGPLARYEQSVINRSENFNDPRQEWRRLFSELLGTFFLVLAAAGGGMMGHAFPGVISHTAAVTAPALTVMGIILYMGKISGAHLNPAVSIAFAKRPDALPEGFLEDRAKFSGRNIDPAAMTAAVPHLLDQLRAHIDWLDQMLADGRSFLQGAAAGLADLAAYHPIWFLQRNFGPAAAPLGGFPRLLSWAERVAAIGHGDRRPMTSQGALAVASAATSSTGAVADRDDPIGRQPGQRVTVTPDDTGRDPVVGELVASGVDEITIKRNDPAVGEVFVHFPRAGFAVTPA